MNTRRTTPTAYTPSTFALEMISEGVCFECPCGEPMYTAEACFTCSKCRVYAPEGYSAEAFDYRTGETTVAPWVLEARAYCAAQDAIREDAEARNGAGLDSGFSQLAEAFRG